MAASYLEGRAYYLEEDRYRMENYSDAVARQPFGGTVNESNYLNRNQSNESNQNALQSPDEE